MVRSATVTVWGESTLTDSNGTVPEGGVGPESPSLTPIVSVRPLIMLAGNCTSAARSPDGLPSRS